MLKICKRCSLELELSSFWKHKLGKHGVRSMCKLCETAEKRDKYAALSPTQREKLLERVKAYSRNNPEKRTDCARRSREKRQDAERLYRMKNTEKNRIRLQKWRKANPAKAVASVSRRRVRKLLAEPLWLTAIQKAQVQSFYEIAMACDMQTGIKHHVDHVVPLQGKTVCGLHVPWNLQVIPAKDNFTKNNKLVEVACG